MVNVVGAFRLWTKALCGQRPVDVATRDGRLGPFKALLLPPSPRPLRGRTCIIESAFQYLFSLLLLWVAVTVYIICLSVLPGSCSLLAERFEEGEGGEKGETLRVYCHHGWWPGCLGMKE